MKLLPTRQVLHFKSAFGLHKPQIRKRHFVVSLIVIAVLCVGFYGLGRTSRTYNLKLSDNTNSTSVVPNAPTTNAQRYSQGQPSTTIPSSSPLPTSTSTPSTSPTVPTDTNDSGNSGSNTTAPTPPTIVSTNTCYVSAVQLDGSYTYGAYSYTVYSDGSIVIPMGQQIIPTKTPRASVECLNNQPPIAQGATG